MKEILDYLRNKYPQPKNTKEFNLKFNEQINQFHSKEENYLEFKSWVEDIARRRNLHLTMSCSTFFPSMTFYVQYEHRIIENLQVFKQEYFCISFIENFYTSVFTTYIIEENGKDKLFYTPRSKAIRNSIFDPIHNDLIQEIQAQYPSHNLLPAKLDRYILGNFDLTYSRHPKTRVFDLIFRDLIVN
ncbi:MAG: hypothetical protein P1U56_16030 [Saprospiraceae bacterium]|nr:hypothetical protein [Saprospiraceae bacterium]